MSEVNVGASAAEEGGSTISNDAKNIVVHADEAAFVKTSSNVSEVSSALKTLSESFKGHLDQAMAEMKDQTKRDTESMLAVMQQESAKRTALEQRLHSQLLLQNEYMVAMELKLLRLEAKVERREAVRQQQQNQQQHQQLQQRSYHHPYSANRLPSSFTTINESALEMPSTSHPNSNTNSQETPPTAVISSGASLASGVTAGSFLGEDGDEEAHDDRSENRSDTMVSDSGNPVTREVDENDRHASEQSTPTQGSRPRVTVGGENGTLESILLNPMIGESNLQGLSVRATRGVQDTDGNSSLATSVTNSTFTSTVVTQATRGDGSTINVRRVLPEEQSEVDIHTPSRRGRPNWSDDVVNREEPRSRSQSPLTVATHASETLSMASASTVGTSIRSSVAIAPRGGFGRRAIPPALAGATVESRPLPDRVVSFTPDLTSLPAPPYSVEAADSITMPDELDNISEVADTFASNASAWREEYEARLDALHKRWSNE